MSEAWKNGSTSAWRRVRAQVLARDGNRCRLQLVGCTTVATQVHHKYGRRVSGDDPAELVAACRECNLKVGDPTLCPPPAPRRHTQWGV